MGTRSLTVFKDKDKEIAVLYRQMDGYPSGQGADLDAILAKGNIVNGYGGNMPGKAFNGMSDLAVRTIVDLKTGGQEYHNDIGGFYLYPAGTRDCGEEYIYTVYADKNNQVCIRVHAVYGDVTLYDGKPEGLVAGCEKTQKRLDKAADKREKAANKKNKVTSK